MALTSLGTKIALENKNLGIKDREASGMTAFDKAIEAHERAVEIAPENATVWTYKANNLAKIGSFTDNLSILNESLQAFDKALELNPEDADAWHGKGIALVYISQTREDTSRYEEALRYIDRALEIDPQTAGALENKAGILSELGRQNESDKFYSEALELYNTSIETEKSTEDLVEAWLSKGFILQAQGKYEDAVKALGNATDADPMNGLAWKVKGVLLWRELKEYDDAVNAFDKALQINPKDPLTWMNKGDALKALGRQAEADEAYAKARELGYQG
jgi:tetratricopeptide (TPR) repeat protein